MNQPSSPTPGTSGPATEAGDDSGPRHARIRKVLEQRVRDGVYPVGSLMPTEIELAAEFDASRFTVREALRHLTENGYVERRQGVGTRVIAARPQATYTQSFDHLHELFQVAVDTFYVVMEVNDVVLDAGLAEDVGGLPGETWIRIDGVRWTEPGGKPLCYIQSYVPERFRDIVPQFRGLQGPFFALLEQHSEHPIDECVQEIRALPMPEAFQRQLGQAPGGYAMLLLRRYVTAGGVLIASFNWHPAEHMTYVMRIHRSKLGGPA
ncbi:MAG: GntR family transcriptional regulator [Albimonas sp.]|uniref:GntR family transcriptional regulator n=1 Tax=Albimonas sp. TaxID=1872425 RepID=UPI0040565667